MHVAWLRSYKDEMGAAAAPNSARDRKLAQRITYTTPCTRARVTIEALRVREVMRQYGCQCGFFSLPTWSESADARRAFFGTTAGIRRANLPIPIEESVRLLSRARSERWTALRCGPPRSVDARSGERAVVRQRRLFALQKSDAATPPVLNE